MVEGAPWFGDALLLQGLDKLAIIYGICRRM
jgi:hypothetical protein